MMKQIEMKISDKNETIQMVNFAYGFTSYLVVTHYKNSFSDINLMVLLLGSFFILGNILVLLFYYYKHKKNLFDWLFFVICVIFINNIRENNFQILFGAFFLIFCIIAMIIRYYSFISFKKSTQS